MITILHGDNTVLSRQQLYDILERQRTAGRSIKSFQASELDVPKLMSAVQPSSLFGDEQVVVVERLFRLRSKKQLEQFLSVLCDNCSSEIVIWEDKNIPAASLKPLQAAQPNVQAFKTSPVVFQLLDLIGNPAQRAKLLQLLHHSYQQDSAEFVFSMIAGRIRQLIAVSEGQTNAIKAFTLNKLRQQVRHFSLSKLLRLHEQLYQIDLAQKRSATLLTLEQQLDLFVLAASDR